MGATDARRRKRASLASAAATGILVACSVVVAMLSVWRVIGQPEPTDFTRVGSSKQPDWRDYAEVGGVIGVRTAAPSIVVFTDYQCPWCRRLDDVILAVLADSGPAAKVVYRHWPIASIHPHARMAAATAVCADRQFRFEQVHRELFLARDSLGLVEWSELARRGGVSDIVSFTRCLQNGEADAALQRDSIDAIRLGVTVTPTVLADGKRFNGSLPHAQVSSLLGRKELAAK